MLHAQISGIATKRIPFSLIFMGSMRSFFSRRRLSDTAFDPFKPVFWETGCAPVPERTRGAKCKSEGDTGDADWHREMVQYH